MAGLTPYYDRDGIVIYHADCMDVMPLVPPDAVDLLLTDPPYGINYNPSSTVWTADDAVHGDDEPFDPSVWLRYRRIILWGADNFAHALPPSRSWIVWEKRNRQDSSQSGLRIPDCELAWTNIPGRHRVFNQLWAGPMRSPNEANLHPTQKSIHLMRWIIDRWTEPGQLVFDPYMGSGPIAQACHELGRRYIGVEIVEEYCEVAVKRLAQQVLPF